MSAMRGIVLLPEQKKKTDYLPHSSDQNKATSIILLRHAFAQLHAPACMYKLLATSIFKPLYKLVKAVEVKLVENVHTKLQESQLSRQSGFSLTWARWPAAYDGSSPPRRTAHPSTAFSKRQP
jgi:hypothetical protein